MGCINIIEHETIKVTPPALPVIYTRSQATIGLVWQPGGSPTGALGFVWEKGLGAQPEAEKKHRPGVQLEPPAALPRLASVVCLSPPCHLTAVSFWVQCLLN